MFISPDGKKRTKPNDGLAEVRAEGAVVNDKNEDQQNKSDRNVFLFALDQTESVGDQCAVRIDDGQHGL